MKKQIFLASLFLAQAVMAEPIVWNGKFYPDKQFAEKIQLIPSYTKPSRALAIEISKAEKYFVGPDALVWQKINILKQYVEVQEQMLMAKQMNNLEAITHALSVKKALNLQLSWINEKLSLYRSRWI